MKFEQIIPGTPCFLSSSLWMSIVRILEKTASASFFLSRWPKCHIESGMKIEFVIMTWPKLFYLRVDLHSMRTTTMSLYWNPTSLCKWDEGGSRYRPCDRETEMAAVTIAICTWNIICCKNTSLQWFHSIKTFHFAQHSAVCSTVCQVNTKEFSKFAFWPFVLGIHW